MRNLYCALSLLQNQTMHNDNDKMNELLKVKHKYKYKWQMKVLSTRLRSTSGTDGSESDRLVAKVIHCR